MLQFKNLLNRINLIYPICGYLLLVVLLVFFKIKFYNYNLSSLIGIWKGFSSLNPDLIEKNFIIFTEGGYDGQFFYLIAKSLYTSGLESFPVLDSFYLRFNRIGLPILSGMISKLFGFSNYSFITLSVLTLTHIYSFILLFKMLTSHNKLLSYFYLFSPFALNSNLLLVSDSLFVSFSIFCIYFIRYFGVNIFNRKSIEVKNGFIIFILFFLILLFTILVKESGLIVLASLFLILIYDRKKQIAIPIFFAIITYLISVQIFRYRIVTHPGTNPLGFLELIDYPFFGFYKSIQFSSISDIKSLSKEFAKFPVFLYYLTLILNLKNIKTIRDILIFIPILFILFTAGIGEQGYWLSFDNISRMFSVSIPWIILLKNENEKYYDYYSLRISILILLLLIIRMVYIKTTMNFFIY